MSIKLFPFMSSGSASTRLNHLYNDVPLIGSDPRSIALSSVQITGNDYPVLPTTLNCANWTFEDVCRYAHHYALIGRKRNPELNTRFNVLDAKTWTVRPALINTAKVMDAALTDSGLIDAILDSFQGSFDPSAHEAVLFSELDSHIRLFLLMGLMIDVYTRDITREDVPQSLGNVATSDFYTIDPFGIYSKGKKGDAIKRDLLAVIANTIYTGEFAEAKVARVVPSWYTDGKQQPALFKQFLEDVNIARGHATFRYSLYYVMCTMMKPWLSVKNMYPNSIEDSVYSELQSALFCSEVRRDPLNNASASPVYIFRNMIDAFSNLDGFKIGMMVSMYLLGNPKMTSECYNVGVGLYTMVRDFYGVSSVLYESTVYRGSVGYIAAYDHKASTFSRSSIADPPTYPYDNPVAELLHNQNFDVGPIVTPGVHNLYDNPVVVPTVGLSPQIYPQYLVRNEHSTMVVPNPWDERFTLISDAAKNDVRFSGLTTLSDMVSAVVALTEVDRHNVSDYRSRLLRLKDAFALYTYSLLPNSTNVGSSYDRLNPLVIETSLIKFFDNVVATIHHRLWGYSALQKRVSGAQYAMFLSYPGVGVYVEGDDSSSVANWSVLMPVIDSPQLLAVLSRPSILSRLIRAGISFRVEHDALLLNVKQFGVVMTESHISSIYGRFFKEIAHLDVPDTQRRVGSFVFKHAERELGRHMVFPHFGGLDIAVVNDALIKQQFISQMTIVIT